MRVFRKLEDLPKFRNAIISIGTFDGVHLGHQKILNRLNSLAEANQGESILITFHPHPRFVIPNASKDLKLLNTLEEKIALLEFYKLDNLVVAPFSHKFSQMSALSYIEDFLVKNFQPNTIVIGYDHHFGINRSGNITLLREYQNVFNFKIEEISKEVLEDIDISSTKIRNALLAGEIEIANQLLGHTYDLNGVVIKGEQLGRQLGFPTANLQLSVDYKLIPQLGVYAVKTIVRDKVYKGMLNIGYRPTIEGTNKTIELNIFDFEEDIYGEQIQIQLLHYIRAERKFESIEFLKEQLVKDKLSALNFLN